MKLIRQFVAASLLVSGVAYAATGTEQLQQFFENTKSARASFSQVVVSKSGKTGQKASGSMLFQRPGKFRWNYEKPYDQLIVGDGSKLWTYDKDLNQVVVKSLGQAIGSSPAALLAGSNDLDKNFTVRDAGERDGMAWIEATPKSQDSGFELVRIGFKGGVPQAMEVHDNFGQTTQLQFAGFERNPSVSADSFRFTPPKGADVVGE